MNVVAARCSSLGFCSLRLKLGIEIGTDVAYTCTGAVSVAKEQQERQLACLTLANGSFSISLM